MEESCPATPPYVSPGRNSKSPADVPSTSESDRGSSKTTAGGRDSPDTNCVICLGKLQNKSFTDSCLHQFCFLCLLKWSEVKAECPLCKQPFKSIIHNVRSIMDYDQYEVQTHQHVERTLGNIINVRSVGEINASNIFAYNFNLLPVTSRFRYRTTRTREYFQEIAQSLILTTYREEGRIPPSQRPLPPRTRTVGRREFRRSIYQRNLWVQELPDVSGRYRECTPQFYRDNPAQTHRLVPWLKRELGVLLQTPINPSCVMAQILSSLTQYSILSDEFRCRIRPFLLQSTDHFIHEFYTFARSAFDVQGFDQNATYEYRAPSSDVEATSSSTRSIQDVDSDIEVLDARISEPVIAIDDDARPGPSGLSQHPVETINISDSDSNDEADDVVAIDYIKPEPEVVVLSSGDEQTRRSRLSSTTTDVFEPVSEVKSSTEEYLPRRSKRKKKKVKNIKRKSRSKRKRISSSSSSSSKSSKSSRSSSCNTSNSESDDDKPLRRKHTKTIRQNKMKLNKRKKYEESGTSSSSSDNYKYKHWKKQKIKSCVIVPRNNSYDDHPSCSGYQTRNKLERHSRSRTPSSSASYTSQHTRSTNNNEEDDVNIDDEYRTNSDNMNHDMPNLDCNSDDCATSTTCSYTTRSDTD